MKFFWVDTETTGLDPVKNGIIQIAGIIIINGVEEERFDLKCRPNDYEEIEQKALDTNNLTVDIIKEYPDPKETYLKLKNMFMSYVSKYDKKDKFYAAGKNVKFDLGFLNQFFVKNGTPHPKQNCSGDPFFFSFVHSATLEVETLAVLYELKFGKKIFLDYKLGTLCKTVGIDLENAHDAMADIDASRKIAQFFMKEIRNGQ